MSVGSEYQDNFQQNQGNYDVQPFVQYFSDRRTSNIFSAYAQDEIHLRKNLVLNLGLRYDHYSTFGGTTNPRAALIYNPWEKTTFKLLYGQSFRAPNLFELFYDAPGNEANPSLRPETVKTMELVWEQYFANHFRLTASGFYYPIHSLISEQVDPATGNAFFANAGSLDLRGLDLELARKLPGGLEGTVSYSFQEATNPSTRMTLHEFSETPRPGKPQRAPHSDKSSSRAWIFSTSATEQPWRANIRERIVVPNFTLFSRNVLRGWEVSASLYNAFNQKYADPAGNGLAAGRSRSGWPKFSNQSRIPIPMMSDSLADTS